MLRTITFLIAAGTGAPAFAQYPPPGSVAPPGSIIVARDVPQRPAFAPGQPGTVTAVETAPVSLIFGATNQVVSILTDDQTATITAGVQGRGGGLLGGLLGADSAMNPQYGNGHGQVSAGSFAGGLGGTISGAIGTATGAIGNATGVIGGALSSIGKGD